MFATGERLPVWPSGSLMTPVLFLLCLISWAVGEFQLEGYNNQVVPHHYKTS